METNKDSQQIRHEIKLILTALDVAFPSEKLNFSAYQEKVYLRKNILNGMHNIYNSLNNNKEEQ